MLPVTGDVNAMPRKLSCKLELGNTTVSNVKMLTYSTDWSGAITIGQVISAYFTATIPTLSGSISGVNVSLSMGIGSSVEWVKIGDFRVSEESIRTRQGYTSFSAYDKLYNNSLNTYHSSLTFPATLQAVCDEVCGLIGITSTNIGVSVTLDENILDGYTLRDVLGFIAAYCGKNAFLSPSGALQLRWFSASSYTADGTRANVPYIGESDCTVSRLICQNQDGVITSGAGQGIYFTCPFMTQARLDTLRNLLAGFTYRKAEVDIPYGNFCLQTGDIITVTTTGSSLTVPIMANSWTYDGGLSSAVSSYGVSDYTGTANNAERPISALRVQNILEVKRAGSKVSEEIEHATEMITGATGGVIKLNFGGNGKTAELLILDTGDIDTAQNVWRMNQGGFGHSDNGYDGPYTTAITADGHVVADVIAGNKISGVKLESTAEGSGQQPQVIVEEGAYVINRVSSGGVTNIGSIAYVPRQAADHQDTIAIAVKPGGAVTIGDTGGGGANFYFFSEPSSGEPHFILYGDMRLFGDIFLPGSLPGTGSLLAKLNDFEQRIAALEAQI